MATGRPNRPGLEGRQSQAIGIPPDDIRESITLLMETVLAVSPQIVAGDDRARLVVLLARMQTEQHRRYASLEASIKAAPKREPIDAILAEFPPARPFDMAEWAAKITDMRRLLAAGLPELAPLKREYKDRIDDAERRLSQE